MSVDKQLLRVLARHADSVCIRIAPKSSQKALLDWSEIPDGADAKERGRRQPMQASSSCECWPDTHEVCIHIAPKSSQQALLDWSEIRDGSGAKQRGRAQSSIGDFSHENDPGRWFPAG